MPALAKQRDQGLAHAPRAERVRLERLAHGIKVRVLGALPLVVKDGGVVNQHVELTEPLFDLMPRGIDALRIGDVQLNGYDLQPTLLQRTRCILALLQIARAED